VNAAATTAPDLRGLRDREGIAQIVFDPKHPSFPMRALRNEDVLRVRGTCAPPRERERQTATAESKSALTT